MYIHTDLHPICIVYIKYNVYILCVLYSLKLRLNKGQLLLSMLKFTFSKLGLGFRLAL